MSKRINLNQSWQFVQNACRYEELGNQEFTEINVPHTWNTQDGQNGADGYHRGLCWYRKVFDFSMQRDQAAFLEFEAVNSVADVFLNGVYLGRHKGGYSAFRFDVSGTIQNGSNLLVVGVDNSHYEDVYPLLADFTFYGGIYRDVSIVVAEAVHFEMMDSASSGVYVSQRSVTDQCAELEVRALVANPGQKDDVTVRVELKDATGNSVAADVCKMNAGGTEATLALHVEHPILWNGIENPYLYSLEAAIESNGKIMDALTIPTGLRYFRFDGDKGFFLNGKQYRLNGVSRHQDREGVGNALTQAHQAEDMEIIKEIGANSIRLAHYQHNQYFYDLCDKAGMVVWAEVPYITRTSELPDYAENAISQMKELIKQSYNHPSIVMWGVQNEIGIFPNEKPLMDIVRTMHSAVKALDTTRVTTQAQVMMIKEDDPANWETDIVAFNQYHGWYVGQTSGYDAFINAFRTANPHRCMGYSEYGAEGIVKWHSEEPKVKDYSEEYHAKFHEEAMEIFNRYDFVWGTYVWSMFDFGSAMRDEGGVKGRNSKGLVTFDRKIKKDAFYFYKTLWSKTPTVHITSKRFELRAMDAIKVKVYSNLGTVTLYVNGRELETKRSSSNIFIFDVQLKPGENRIMAKSGMFEDEACFTKIDKPNDAYVLPEFEKKKGINLDFLDSDSGENVKNWFVDALENSGETKEIVRREGYFSVFDKMSEIMKNPEGERFMRKKLKPLVENGMFAMISSSSLKDLQGFQKESLPDELLYAINEELSKIKK